MEIKILYTDNGVVFIDKEVSCAKVVPFGENEDSTQIYQEIGKAIYEEWKARNEKASEHPFGVKINVRFTPIKKDVLI